MVVAASDYWAAELVKRGMSEARAGLLASTAGLDLHAICEAIDSGCTPANAWKIWNQEPEPRRRTRKPRSLRETSP